MYIKIHRQGTNVSWSNYVIIPHTLIQIPGISISLQVKSITNNHYNGHKNSTEPPKSKSADILAPSQGRRQTCALRR